MFFVAACTSHPPDFQTAHRAQYRAALHSARAWLDGVRVDPAELRAHGIKGKKKLAEQLDAYARLWKVAPAGEKEALRARAHAVAAVTADPRYHDFGHIGDEQLKQDATSYFRVAVLMERFGFDTSAYRAELKKAQPRIDAQMQRRGPHQQRMFHEYYAHFGLAEPFPLADALEKGVVAQRVPVAGMTPSQAYELTHEVYALFDYGDRLDADPFSADDVAYLKPTLVALAEAAVQKNEPDLLAEVVECLHYLRLDGEPAFRAGVQALLDGQNADGSWGHYAAQQKQYGAFVQQGYYLHTTLVALAALTAAFDRPMPAR